MIAARDIGRGDRDGIHKRPAEEQGAERVRQGIAGMNIMRPTLRWDEYRRISRASAEVVFVIGTDAEISGVAIEANFTAGLDHVICSDDGEALLPLKEISV